MASAQSIMDSAASSILGGLGFSVDAGKSAIAPNKVTGVPGNGVAFTPTDISPTNTGGVFSDVANAVTDVTDFLKFLGWIFYPLNWLRAVEFLTGLFLFSLGIRPYLQTGRSLGATGSGLGRAVRSTLSATPAGREMRTVQGKRMGTREGQREAARMGARREATRTEREASSRERYERETRNRRNARNSNL